MMGALPVFAGFDLMKDALSCLISCLSVSLYASLEVSLFDLKMGALSLFLSTSLFMSVVLVSSLHFLSVDMLTLLRMSLCACLDFGLFHSY